MEGEIFRSLGKMEELEPGGRDPERDHGNTPEAQRARSMIVYKDHEMGQGRSQVRVGG